MLSDAADEPLFKGFTQTCIHWQIPFDTDYEYYRKNTIQRMLNAWYVSNMYEASYYANNLVFGHTERIQNSNDKQTCKILVFRK